MRMAVKIGSVGPLHASAVGKSMLAFKPHEEAKPIIDALSFPQLTPKSLPDRKAYESELENVRKNGFALDDEEQSLGLRCIAAPVFNEFSEPVCALSISGPTVRVSQARTASLALLVQAAADRVTEKLGGKKPD
jgi:IclR family acetate operon transcriptional repressor